MNKLEQLKDLIQQWKNGKHEKQTAWEILSKIAYLRTENLDDEQWDNYCKQQVLIKYDVATLAGLCLDYARESNLKIFANNLFQDKTAAKEFFELRDESQMVLTLIEEYIEECNQPTPAVGDLYRYLDDIDSEIIWNQEIVKAIQSEAAKTNPPSLDLEFFWWRDNKAVSGEEWVPDHIRDVWMAAAEEANLSADQYAMLKNYLEQFSYPEIPLNELPPVISLFSKAKAGVRLAASDALDFIDTKEFEELAKKSPWQGKINYEELEANLLISFFTDEPFVRIFIERNSDFLVWLDLNDEKIPLEDNAWNIHISKISKLRDISLIVEKEGEEIPFDITEFFSE